MEVCLEHTRPRRRASRAPPRRPPSPSRPPSRTRRARWLPASLYAGVSEAGYVAAHRRTAHRDAHDGLHVLATLLEGGEKALLEVLQEPHGPVVQLRGGSWPLLGGSYSPLSALFPYRLTEERLTEKVWAAWSLDIPPPTAETTLVLRSSE